MTQPLDYQSSLAIRPYHRPRVAALACLLFALPILVQLFFAVRLFMYILSHDADWASYTNSRYIIQAMVFFNLILFVAAPLLLVYADIARPTARLLPRLAAGGAILFFALVIYKLFSSAGSINSFLIFPLLFGTISDFLAIATCLYTLQLAAYFHAPRLRRAALTILAPAAAVTIAQSILNTIQNAYLLHLTSHFPFPSHLQLVLISAQLLTHTAQLLFFLTLAHHLSRRAHLSPPSA